MLHNGADPIREAFLLAAYRRSLRGVDEHGQRFDVTEPALNAADRDLLGGTDPLDALKATPFAALRLWEQPAFIDAYLAMVDSIDGEGIDAALRRT